jgi:hypothetical protein
MSIQLYKKCSYIDCSSHQNTNSDLTFFQFPKHKDKQNIWIKNSQCTEPVKNKYLCELHFSNIYINKCFKRKMLLNTAVPFAIGQTEETFKAPVLMVERERKKYTPSESDTVSSINIKDENPSQLISIIDDDDREEEFLDDDPEIDAEQDDDFSVLSDVPEPEKSMDAPLKKRKLEAVDPKDVVSSSSTRQRVAAPAAVQQVRHNFVVKQHKVPAKSSPNVEQVEIDEEQSSSQAQEETTQISSKEPIAENFYEFIFKGEEYIQIPKKVFLDQKAEMRKLLEDIERVRAEERAKVQQLKRELTRYRTLIESVKDQFSNF